MEIKKKVVVGREESEQIFKEFHDSAEGGHFGQHKTRGSISARFYWPGMGIDIDKWVGPILD